MYSKNVISFPAEGKDKKLSYEQELIRDFALNWWEPESENKYNELNKIKESMLNYAFQHLI